MYSIVKITYEATRGVYYWYYDEENPDNKKIKNLENRIEELINYTDHNNDVRAIIICNCIYFSYKIYAEDPLSIVL